MPGTVKFREVPLTALVTVIFSGYSSALPRLTGGSLASTAAARSTSARRTEPGTARSSPSTKMVNINKFPTFFPIFAFVSGTTIAKNGQAYDNKSGQWLGSLVASSGADGTIMVSGADTRKIFFMN